jgi:hypothetical protein
MSDPVDPEQALRDLQAMRAWIAMARQDLAEVGELSWAAFYLRQKHGAKVKRPHPPPSETGDGEK